MPRKKKSELDEQEDEASVRVSFLEEYVIDARILALYRLLFKNIDKKYI